MFVVYFSHYSITQWLPTMYTTVFKMPVDQALTLALITACINFVASILPTLVSDRIGRRPLIVWPMLFGAIVVGVLFLTGARDITVVVVMVSLAVLCFANMSTLSYLYVPENYPTRMRAVGSGSLNMVMRIATIAGPYVTGFIVPLYGLSAVFLVVAVVLLIGFFVMFRWAIETKGEALEQIAP
jgi:putative MFS transporter